MQPFAAMIAATKRWTKTVVLAAFAASVWSCASPPLPAARVGSAEAGVREARAAGAERIPNAASHLRLAELQIERARRLIEDGEPDRAHWMLLRAEADAAVAAALSREAEQKVATDEAASRARTVAAQPREESR